MTKAVNQVANSVSVQIKVERLAGLANVLLTRHMVAGHPLGGKMQNQT